LCGVFVGEVLKTAKKSNVNTLAHSGVISASTKPVANRVGEIDLLRFLAAIAVVLFHYTFRGYAASNYSPMAFPEISSVTKYGYLGVELFFLISGFVILMTASSGSLNKFVASRVARLYPAFWLSCTVTFMIVLTFGGERFSADTKQFLLNLTMLHEFIHVKSIDGVYWSLTIELKFYAMVVLVLLLRQIHRAETFLMAWLAVSIMLIFFPLYRLREIFIVDYSPYFVGGAVCFLIYQRGWSLNRLAMIFVSLALAIYGALHSLEIIEKTYSTPFDGASVAAIICIFFGVMMLVASRKLTLVAERNWMLVGALTYPLYLIHQNIGYIMLGYAHNRVNSYVALLTVIGTMLLAAYAIHRFVEKPFAKPLRVLCERALAKIRIAR
jgi:peptidoglycan/LPS O-acetylase OafA/YrhL